VVDAALAQIQLEAEIGGYEAERQAADRIANTYAAVARLLGCTSSEVAIVDSATRAWDIAFYSIPFKAGDRILTSMSEYISNYIAFLQVSERTGALIETIPNDEYGATSVEALRSMIDERVRLIAINHVPTNGGLVNPAAEIGKVARAAGVLYLLDACQSAGQIPLDVQVIGCDFLSAAGRKYLRAPRGTGFLYVRGELIEQLEPPMLDMQAANWVAKGRYELQADARRFEQLEANYAAKIGLGVAVDYALGWGLEEIRQRVSALAEMLRARLRAIPAVTVRDLGRVRSGIVTFTVEGKSPTDLRAALWPHHINVWAINTASARLDMEARGLSELVRASVHYYNTEDEIEHFCEVLATLLPAK
jgi:cysteine desulfurase/selenocysteine lyase